MKKVEVYCSSDVEANGRIPGRNSMLSFATAAFTIDKKIIGTFSANLELLEGSVEDKDTMETFWNKPENQPAYLASRVNPQPIKETMERYVEWVESLPGVPVFVAWPAPYDKMWISWYSHFFVGRDPYSHSDNIDVRSYAMGFLGQRQLIETTKSKFPGRWFSRRPHTHVALDDAVEQGELFINMHRENLGLTPIE